MSSVIVLHKPEGYSLMERINAIAEGVAALREGMDHITDKVDKIDARTQTHTEQYIRQDMRIQALHTHHDEMAKIVAEQGLKLTTHESIIQQAKGANRLWNVITAIVGAIFGAATTIWALIK